ncbi:MAG: Mur ligase domain-containing protein [Chloroflexota bacterium]
MARALVPIASVQMDSRRVTPGALFVAVPGNVDGHDLVPAAVASGAVAVIGERVTAGAGVPHGCS